MIYDIEYETMPREALESIQLRRLQTTLQRVYASVPFYRETFKAAGITPADIKTLKDLKYVPFTTKQDLRDNYPFNMFAVPMDNVVRIHASSGTTGQPTVVGYTARDVGTWSTLMARALSAGGAGRGDIIHNAYGYGLFTGGLGVHYGAERLGASVIPVSGGNTKRQVVIMKDFGATVITSTPSYALHLAEIAEDMGVSFASLKFKFGIFGAEPWSEKMREELERKLNLTAVDIYGLSEVMGPGVAIECHEAKKGLHVFEDHFIAEIVDPKTLEPLPYGETGELVFTSLTKEAFPVIRYRTRDITSLNPEPCVCGRTHVRMNRVTGRSDDMLIIRGVNVFPSQIESVLMEIKEVEPHYQLVVDREDNLDVLTVKVEVGERGFSDEVKGLQQLERRITKTIKELLGVSANVKLVEPKAIERSQGKAIRVVDNRQI
ncbi:phenylacetate-coenzyme A ligase [Desulfosarcina ovata subsp. sediminis]|uniref:Phenylacetate-coenzyme A ligase n=3 Tax=Desulfosarcina ovata TaxID=83564 RepID=A0A5K8A782_9BACT|nr:phenylacetate--CoA ligase [Desulfosarcina ovata]BBO79691.1 phenylacetate-coenzyme A ligase [Desulfosarcina ovata subsp. sediminis]BBO88377.1 phenylacetate-coenzyme A ligase [Desulfosarcina ovata subsp. ovata]